MEELQLTRAKARAVLTQLIDLYGREEILNQILPHVEDKELSHLIAISIGDLDRLAWIKGLPHIEGNGHDPNEVAYDIGDGVGVMLRRAKMVGIEGAVTDRFDYPLTLDVDWESLLVQ